MIKKLIGCLIFGAVLGSIFYCIGVSTVKADEYRIYKNGKELQGKFKKSGKRIVFKECPPAIVPTPTPESTPEETPIPTVEVIPTPVPPPEDVPFKEVFEIARNYPKDGDFNIPVNVQPELIMSMYVNGDRLGEEAFELKPVIEMDYDTLILGDEIICNPVLYSIEGDGTKARNIRLEPEKSLENQQLYRLLIKSDEHLVAANAGGSKLEKDFVILFSTVE